MQFPFSIAGDYFIFGAEKRAFPAIASRDAILPGRERAFRARCDRGARVYRARRKGGLPV